MKRGRQLRDESDARIAGLEQELSVSRGRERELSIAVQSAHARESAARKDVRNGQNVILRLQKQVEKGQTGLRHALEIQNQQVCWPFL